MGKKYKIFVGIIALVLVLSVSLLKMRKNPQKALAAPTVKVSRGDILVTVNSVGTVEATERQNEYAQISGVVTYIAAEGVSVKKGDILVKLDNRELLAEEERAKYRLMRENAEYTKLAKGAREEEIKKVEIKLSEAQSDYQQALIDFQRYERLFKEGAIAKQELETVEQRLQEKNTLLSLAEADLSILKNIDPLEMEVKKAQLYEAENEYENIRDKTLDTVIYAQIDGIVLNTKVEEGMSVSQGTELITVGDITKLEITADVNEFDSSKIKKGQEVKITGDGFENLEYKGVVSKIAPLATKKENSGQGSDTILKVTVKIVNPDDNIKPGFLTNLEVKVANKKDVLLLPLECIVEEKNTKKVIVVEGDMRVSKPVRTGIYNELYIEIIEGLSEGEEVLQDPVGSEGEAK